MKKLLERERERLKMNEDIGTWQVIYIPNKPEVPPDQQPTVNVFASKIEPKTANSLIRRLNQIAPLENLRHVKRIHKTHLEGGKTQLSVILCLASEDRQFDSLPQDVQELISSYQLSPYITKVCKYAALSRDEWEEQCKLWPTSFHPPTYNIDGITGFNDKDSQSVFNFMKVAIELAKSGDGSIVNAAVIVDPSVQQTIASGCDQLCSWLAPTKKTSTCNSDLKQPEVNVACPDSNGVSSHAIVLPNDTPERAHIGVSCLNPWQWPKQQLDRSASCYWHPLRHAAIVAIESSAERDRQLFPGIGANGIKLSEAEFMQPSCPGSPAKRQKTSLANVEIVKELDANTEDSHAEDMRPYLCTGYDIFLVWEPCIMCAMALVHQRIRRVFYAFPNPNAGALGSIHRLQGEKSLNHHYAVFRVIPPNEVLNNFELPVARAANS